MRTTLVSELLDLRKKMGSAAIKSLFEGLSAVGQMHPRAKPSRYGITRTRDVPYLPSSLKAHMLDVYCPAGPGPHPVVMHIHGGGFRILSKDTHWLMALILARAGYLVFNINYRLAPEHRFPAAIEDACAAYEFVVKEAARFGGDVSRLALAGESSGANLALGVTLATTYSRAELYAQRVWALGCVPKATVPFCGLLQVSHMERLTENKRLSTMVKDRMHTVSDGYLGPDKGAPGDFADPLLWLERNEPPERELPAFFVPVGTADPLLDDSRRLGKALEALDVSCHVAYYPNELHAFHAFVWRANAKMCWDDTLSFLSQAL